MTAILLVFVGWTLLAGSQPRQFSRIVRHRHLPGRIRLALRSAGVALLLAALAILLRAEGASFGFLVWACVLSVSAMAVALALALLSRLTSGAG